MGLTTPALPPLITRQRNAILVALLALAALAWMMVVWQAGSDDHGAMGGSMDMGSMSAEDMGSTAMDMGSPASSLDLTMGMGAGLYLAMWVAMMTAMMFPAAAPMILLFARMERGKRDRGKPYVPTAVFTGSYLALWAAFGLLAFGLSAGLERVAEDSTWIVDGWERIGAVVLIGAGLYQLSPLKDRCLTGCRTPLAFLMSAWRPGTRGAVRLGLRHGAYCLGCCWLLFVVLVTLGVMNVAAMLAVTLVVFAEKTMPGGEQVARAVAVGLVVLGAVVLVSPGALPSAVV